MENSSLRELWKLASLRQRNKEQMIEFFEKIQTVLAGSPFLEVLENFTREEKIEVNGLYLEICNAFKVEVFPAMHCIMKQNAIANLKMYILVKGSVIS
jgi:hypothetical protein